MLNKKISLKSSLITVAVFAFVILFHLTGNINISIKTASPLLIIPLITAFSIFSTPIKSAMIGILLGACLDCIKPFSYCFNTIIFLILAVAICLLANNLFNKNVRSAAALSLICSAIYFIAQWLFFSAFLNPFNTAITILMRYSFPSAVYSAIFIFPFYYIFKYLNK